MKLEEIKSEDLKRLLAVKCCRLDFKDVTENDLEKIQEINLSGKRVDGSRSDIDLDVINMLPNLGVVGISNFHIDQHAIDMLLRLKRLSTLDFIDCDFDNIEFSNVNMNLKLRIRGCSKIPFKYPALREVDIIGSVVNFEDIDFSNAIGVTILESKVFNAKDLDDYINIERVRLDGSTLYDTEEKEIADIKTREKVEYSHKTTLELYDNREI